MVLLVASRRLSSSSATSTLSGTWRVILLRSFSTAFREERDTFGPIQVPANKFVEKIAASVAEETNSPFVAAENKFEALGMHDAFVEISGALNTVSASLMKIGNDIRLLGSGPRCGLGELILPENEPGSSVMPVLVRLISVSEKLSQWSVLRLLWETMLQLLLADQMVTFELNVFKPMIASNLLLSLRLLGDASSFFEKNCVTGIQANRERISKLLHEKIGYDDAAAVAKKAHEEGTTLKEAALNLAVVTNEEFDQLVVPEKMISPMD